MHDQYQRGPRHRRGPLCTCKRRTNISAFTPAAMHSRSVTPQRALGVQCATHVIRPDYRHGSNRRRGIEEANKFRLRGFGEPRGARSTLRTAPFPRDDRSDESQSRLRHFEYIAKLREAFA